MEKHKPINFSLKIYELDKLTTSCSDNGSMHFLVHSLVSQLLSGASSSFRLAIMNSPRIINECKNLMISGPFSESQKELKLLVLITRLFLNMKLLLADFYTMLIILTPIFSYTFPESDVTNKYNVVHVISRAAGSKARFQISSRSFQALYDPVSRPGRDPLSVYYTKPSTTNATLSTQPKHTWIPQTARPGFCCHILNIFFISIYAYACVYITRINLFDN